jgi:hypothetical protein
MLKENQAPHTGSEVDVEPDMHEQLIKGLKPGFNYTFEVSLRVTVKIGIF